MVVRDRGAQAAGAGRRRGLPPSHLRRQISGRRALDTAARGCVGRGLPGLAAAYRHQPQRHRAAFDLWHRQQLHPSCAGRIRTDGTRRRGGRHHGLRRRVEADERPWRARHPLQPRTSRGDDAGDDRAPVEAGERPRLAYPDQRTGRQDRGDKGHPEPGPVADRVRPSRAHPRTGGDRPSAVRCGPRADRQGQDVGQAVRRLRRHQGRPTELFRTRAPSRAPMCRRRPSAWCGAATGRTLRNGTTSRTTRSCSTRCSTGPPRSPSETASWCKTRKRSTASKRARNANSRRSGRRAPRR